MTPEAKLASMGLTLPEIPKPLANYVPFKINGSTLYLSGQGPRRTDGSMATGKVGRDVTVEQAYEHAKLVGLGLLAAAKAAVGDLSKIEVLKVLGMARNAGSPISPGHQRLLGPVRRRARRARSMLARRSAWAPCRCRLPSRSDRMRIHE
jgi:hypothetical protein